MLTTDPILATQDLYGKRSDFDTPKQTNDVMQHTHVVERPYVSNITGGKQSEPRWQSNKLVDVHFKPPEVVTPREDQRTTTPPVHLTNKVWIIWERDMEN